MGSIIIIRRYKCVPVSIDAKRRGFHENGFLQVCGGASTEKEMHSISDSLSPLRVSPYKLCCNCHQCISYNYEEISQSIISEPFMRAANIVFNILCKFNYNLQSTTNIQNADGSNTTSWVWTKTNSSVNTKVRIKQ